MDLLSGGHGGSGSFEFAEAVELRVEGVARWGFVPWSAERGPGAWATGSAGCSSPRLVLAKPGARRISAEEAAQVPRNRHAIVRNPHAGADPGRRRLLIGSTDGGRVVTLVIEQTLEPTTWLIVTGWSATAGERRIIEKN